MISILLIAISLPALAATVSLDSSKDAYSIEVLESSGSSSILQYNVHHFDMESVMISGVEYTSLNLGTRALHQEAGLPALPTLRESIAIPDDAEMKIRVIESDFVDFENVDIVPSKGALTRNIDPAMVPYNFDDFYSGDQWFPSGVALLDTPYILRDVRGQVVEINPFLYNPSTHTLRVYHSVTVAVEASGPGRTNVLESRPPARVEEFEKLYRHHFMNYDGSGDRYTSVGEEGDMLVIYYDAFAPQIQPLVDWRNQMGISTEMVPVSMAGSSGSALMSYVQSYYDNPSHNLAFVLLVGDGAQVPYLVNDGGAADPSLSLLAGGDSYPEIFVGRISAENANQVTVQVQKTIEYERDAQAGGDWYHKATGIGSSEGSGIGDDGEADWQHQDNIRADLLGFTYTEVDQIYDPGASSSQVTSAVNAGRSFMNYTGHGSTTAWSTTGFSNSNVNSLSNDNMLPYIVSVACVNGEFMNTTCFAEAWLRATHNGEASGAVAMYASTVNQQWATPMCGQDEIVDLLVAGEKRTYGGLCFNGSCQMMDEYGSNGQTEFKNWTIFGDPALRVRTDTPSALSISHADALDPMADSFQVEAEAGALAAISYNGNLIGSAFADASGTATVPLDGVIPDNGDDVILTVSSFNRFTVVENLPTGPVLIPTCDVTPGELDVTLLSGDTTSEWLHISNNGEAGSVLNWSIEINDPNFPLSRGSGRSMSGSTLSVDPSDYLPGTSVDITVSATNNSSDNEWTIAVALDFPAGIVVNSATDMTGGSGGSLSYNGASGDGAAVEWTDPDGGWGQIYPGETGTATVNVTFTGTGDLVADWTQTGDDWGDNPHSVDGTVTFHMLGPAVNVLAPNGGEVFALGSDVAIEYSAAGGVGMVAIELSRNSGLSWEVLLESAFPSGLYTWTAEGDVSAHCRVRVRDILDSEVSDTSDADFTITNDMSWVVVPVTSGSIPQGSSQSVELLFSAEDRPDGVYEAELFLSSNAEDDLLIPVTLTVYSDLTDAGSTPARVALGQNFPNPFNPTTAISFSLPSGGEVELAVYTPSGERVRTLLRGMQGEGNHHVVWDGSDDRGNPVSSGVYFYRLETGVKTLSRKMLMLK
ncbi:MAG: C25 family cysteine peptidase [Candidatus Krumholzibacteria bacterium]|nr:C25 family cysteine peptidase [Candidatus Krumholzibacteria bacterium]MDP6668881.1 C25 family cysteine peptidase [Candidatus Krumholzibacteria bacterium]MDP6796224.1 C25 family cysteine peptidase [Candidatus Krumholzibacteria bacterium]MDP7022213.1 C25 family cysteine peptidase [Candidatus Krumholzibacteria bacterium]